MATIKALSLWEPWASLMRIGAKTIETRGWATEYRGPLLICSAMRWEHDQRDFYNVEVCPRLGCLGIQFGVGLAIVDLVDCVLQEDSLLDTPRPPDLTIEAGERLWGDFSPGRYAWMTINLRNTFKPFPVTDRQGLFDVEVPKHLEELLS